MNYYIVGSGEPIILLHGWGGSSVSLINLAKYLAKDFKVVVIDLPGFGKSPEPKKIYGIKDYGDEIINLMDRLRLERFNLFGHSFGGQIAAKISLDYPDRIDNLILCAAAIIRKRSWKSYAQIMLAKLIKNTFIKSAFNVLMGNSDYQKASLKMRKVMNKILTEDLADQISGIEKPTLILWGSKDKITPLWQAQIINKQIANSQIKIFPLSRHNLPLVHARLVANQIKRFTKGTNK